MANPAMLLFGSTISLLVATAFAMAFVILTATPRCWATSGGS
jgi:hypothetical protein